MSIATSTARKRKGSSSQTLLPFDAPEQHDDPTELRTTQSLVPTQPSLLSWSPSCTPDVPPAQPNHSLCLPSFDAYRPLTEDVNRRFSELLRTVRDGRSVIVTSHGKPVTRIVPARNAIRRLKAPARLCSPIYAPNLS